jgi:SAM-dependent methyltransferase
MTKSFDQSRDNAVDPRGHAPPLGKLAGKEAKWMRLLARGEKRLAKEGKRQRPPFVPPPDDGKIRLNLGSGDKNLPGYVNVDAAPSRKGVTPDLICDIRQLDLPDQHADEILAIHVIEHFYRWELDDVLADWRRVLKPGGKLILECPNILYAARQLVANPALAAGSGKELRSTMWPLYGDPGWRDPLMCHRWGYTPESLSAILTAAGFVEVREEPAVFKQGAPRDMRITGIRPRVET